MASKLKPVTEATPAPGDWRHVIAARPKLTMLEVVGKEGVIVWGKWFDPKRGKSGAPVTKTTGLSIRYAENHRRAGDINPELEQRAIDIASRWHADLVAGRAPGTGDEAPAIAADKAMHRASLTVVQGFKLYTDLTKGRYSNPDDPNRAEVLRAAEEVVCALGENATWATLVPIEAAQTIWRRVQGRFRDAQNAAPTPTPSPRRKTTRRGPGGVQDDGATWAKRAVGHFFACAIWLASRKHIDAFTRPDDWQREFKEDWRREGGRDLDEEVNGVRFKPEEAKRLLDKIPDDNVDPRLRINILAGGDSLRAGQVRRSMRSDLDLEPTGEFGHGRLRVRGKGKKKGSFVDLDPELRRLIDYERTAGYMRECEAAYQSKQISDYALMAQGRFVQGAVPVRPNGRYLKPISKRTLLQFFHELERLAGVTHVKKRGWYGLRRLWSDLGYKHVRGKRALELLSGHARGSKVPEQVYRDKEDEEAIREAARGRTSIREALVRGTVSDVTALRAAACRVINGTPDLKLLRAVLQLLGAEDPTTNGEPGNDDYQQPQT